jgi:hypothetical protein
MCVAYTGNQFQKDAALVLLDVRKVTVQAWHWISSSCETNCIDPEHLVTNAPRWLNYDSGICVYCGMPAEDRDHLLPISITGTAARKFVLTVPSCKECNSQAIGQFPSANITERRAVAHGYIRRKYAKALQTRDWSAEELEEFEGMLRVSVEAAITKKKIIVSRLSWPHDPNYDWEAITSAGIDDPFSTGLLSS